MATGLSWKDLACAPWFLWALATTIYCASKAVEQTGFAPDALIWLMILISTVPACLIIWSYRSHWAIRIGWIVPSALFATGFFIGLFFGPSGSELIAAPP